MNEAIKLARLKGRQVRLVLSDPWDLVTAIGCGPFRGIVVDTEISGEHLILVKLEDRIVHGSKRCSFVIASARHADLQLHDLIRGASVDCNLVGMEVEKLQPAASLSAQWRDWRDGLSMTADLQLG